MCKCVQRCVNEETMWLEETQWEDSAKMTEIFKFDIQNKKNVSFVKTKSTYSFTVVLFDVIFHDNVL